MHDVTRDERLLDWLFWKKADRGLHVARLFGREVARLERGAQGRWHWIAGSVRSSDGYTTAPAAKRAVVPHLDLERKSA